MLLYQLNVFMIIDFEEVMQSGTVLQSHMHAVEMTDEKQYGVFPGSRNLNCSRTVAIPFSPPFLPLKCLYSQSVILEAIYTMCCTCIDKHRSHLYCIPYTESNTSNVYYCIGKELIHLLYTQCSQ